MADVVQLPWWKPPKELIFFLSPLLCLENPSVCIIRLELQHFKAGCQKIQKTSLVTAYPSCNSMDLSEIIPGVSWAQWSPLSLLDSIKSGVRICNAKLTVDTKELYKWCWKDRKLRRGRRKRKWGRRKSWFQMTISSACLSFLCLFCFYLYFFSHSFIHLHFIFVLWLF